MKYEAIYESQEEIDLLERILIARDKGQDCVCLNSKIAARIKNIDNFPHVITSFSVKRGNKFTKVLCLNKK